MIEAFPLTYPPGKVRCKWPESSRFRTTLGKAIKEVQLEVEAAYKRLASQHHPDKGGDSNQMARINAARDALLGESP